ncbi:hypothetical protein LDVICp077 [lymphocystis disease virus-China]|uniref:Uncharacterized protein n=1 Tax=lymphocystis disease virus-China TaxID=256729 RepID=Q678D4_9VIRU|nr:hypothetical protein LDVICp077 [lymphocystis disease virus-China]AAU10923.1 hypothetical protein [lymphocystis disease virus-China]
MKSMIIKKFGHINFIYFLFGVKYCFNTEAIYSLAALYIAYVLKSIYPLTLRIIDDALCVNDVLRVKELIHILIYTLFLKS